MPCGDLMGRKSERKGKCVYEGFPGRSVVKNPPAAQEAGLSCGSGRSLGEGNGNPPQYSCLKIPKDRGALWPTGHGVTKESDRT